MQSEPLTVAPVQAGHVLAGKYRVDRVLGVGGMGVVVAATHLDLEQPVAVKFMLPEVAKLPEHAARFLREGRAAVRLRSEHVARVFDVGRLDSGEPYMVMELLQGIDLAQVLETHGPLPVRDAVDYLLQACEAIAEAHSAGVVHRDLKPANLFLATDAHGAPCVKVLDFGISKLTKPDGSGQTTGALTSAGAVMGSPQYMSPEQMKDSHEVDARSDIWGLGCVLQELLIGHPPFRADSIPELFAAVLTGVPLPLRTALPSAPQALEAAILMCLEKSPADRPQRVAELVRLLAPFGSERSQLSLQRVAGATSAPPPSVLGVQVQPANAGKPMPSEWGRTVHSAGPWRKYGLAAVAGLGVVALMGASLAAIVHWRGSPEAAPEVSPDLSRAAAATESVPSSAPAAVLEDMADSATPPVVVVEADASAEVPPAPRVAGHSGPRPATSKAPPPATSGSRRDYGGRE